MSKRTSQICCHCQERYTPDARNVRRQRFCAKSACRKASKAESQRRWLERPENRDYFKGSVHVQRVQRWRLTNPGRGAKRQPAAIKPTVPAEPEAPSQFPASAVETPPLQDLSTTQCIDNAYESPKYSPPPIQPPAALQDVLNLQQYVFIGLIAHLTGSSLQDDIVSASQVLLKLGLDISSRAQPTHGGRHDRPPNFAPGPPAPDAIPVQLGGSAAGAGPAPPIL